jgi:hypothetical protein
MFDLGPDMAPPTYTYQYRDEYEPRDSPSFVTAPDSQFNVLLPENIAWQEAPDPIRESDFWDAGHKIKPDAHMWINSHVELGAWQNWEDDTFHIGKLIGYLKVAMHQGGQRPDVIRANIQEPQAITYGSMYEVSPVVTTPGPAYSASGFDISGFDGYPY